MLTSIALSTPRTKRWTGYLLSHKLQKMRFTRSLLLRNAFHYHGDNTLFNLWDSCPGVPYKHSYLIRLLETMTSREYSDYPAVTERPDYGVKESTTYSYRKLGTDVFSTREDMLKVNEIRRMMMAEEVERGYSIGLVADRSYEFVVNLLSLFSIGLRPVLISNTSKAQEIARLMETAKTPFLIPPSTSLNQPLLQELKRDNPTYHIWANERLKSRSHTPPMRENKLAQEYHLPTPLMKQGTILFTSGTTGNPKAVFTDIPSISRQCSGLRTLWEYSADDRILHCLPNHHIHGLVNALLTPLSSGSAVEFITQPFNPHKILSRICHPPSVDFPPITMFHGVPTMYSSFISAYESSPPEVQEEIKKGLRGLRVAVCGSAALPVPVAKKWEEITGSIPLERYGMTETGMVLSNTLDSGLRRLGSVGYPTPHVHVHLLDPDDRLIMVPNVPGRLVVRWHAESQLFHKYWNDVRATNRVRVKPTQVAAHAIEKIENGKVAIKQTGDRQLKRLFKKRLQDHWFRTGDMAVRGVDGEYYMLGRESVDVMKVAGHLVSSLEIEREILSLPEISEVAVVAVKNEKVGHIPQAIIVLKPEFAERYKNDDDGAGYKRRLTESLRKRMRERLSEEKLPRRWIVTDAIPRNAMGKVNKKELLADPTLFPQGKDVNSEGASENSSVDDETEEEESQNSNIVDTEEGESKGKE